MKSKERRRNRAKTNLNKYWLNFSKFDFFKAIGLIETIIIITHRHSLSKPLKTKTLENLKSSQRREMIYHIQNDKGRITTDFIKKQ